MLGNEGGDDTGKTKNEIPQFSNMPQLSTVNNNLSIQRNPGMMNVGMPQYQKAMR